MKRSIWIKMFSVALMALCLSCMVSANYTRENIVNNHPYRPIINACFESTIRENFAWWGAYQDAIKKGVRDSWEAESAIVVKWWSSCDDTSEEWIGVRITVGDGDMTPGRCGQGATRKSCCSPDNRWCWINRKCGQFENSANDFPNFSDPTDWTEGAHKWCLSAWMPHEWGHILGFPHETGRSACSGRKTCGSQCGSDCSLCKELGPCDKVSIMSGSKRKDVAGRYPHLSPNDIAAAQTYYGSPQPAQGIAGTFAPDSYYAVFARGANVKNMWRYWYPGDWRRFSAMETSGSAGISSWGPGRLDVFYRASVAKRWGEEFNKDDEILDGRMFHSYIDTWGSGSHPMNTTDWMGSPVSIAPAPGAVELFGRSGELGNGGISETYARPVRSFWNGSWTQDQFLGDTGDKATGDVEAVRLNADQISVFWRYKPTGEVFPQHEDHNRLIMQTVAVGSTEMGPRVKTKAIIASTPSAIQAQEGYSEVFVRGTNGGVYHLTCTADDCESGPEYAVGGYITGKPSAVSGGVNVGYRSDIWIFGRSQGGNLWMNKLPAGYDSWDGWAMLDTPYQIVGSPKAVNYHDQWLQIFARSNDNELLVGYLFKPTGWFFWHNAGGNIR